MPDSLNHRRQLLACHTQSQESRPPCYYSLGVDGREWDVSNLSSRPRPTSPSTSCQQFKRLSKDYTALYPSRYLVKDIPDVHVNSIFDGRGCQEQQAGPSEQKSTTYHEGLLRRFSEHNMPSRKLDFRDDFTRLSQKPSTRTIYEEAPREDENSDSTTRGEQQQEIVAQEEEELKKPPPATQIEIEVYPSYYLPIRGAAETDRAIQQRRVRPTVCSCCTSQLYCIMVAEYVLCPTCREISPVDFNPNTSLGQHVGGVGLGLTAESLQQEMRKPRIISTSGAASTTTTHRFDR
jgi:hypothetical protein